MVNKHFDYKEDGRLKRSKKPPLVVFLVSSVILILAGIILVKYGYANFVLASRVEPWKEIQGRIAESKLVVKETKNGEGIPITARIPQVIYVYSIRDRNRDETIFRGSRIFLYPNDPILKETPEETVERLPQGKEITVYYNPHNPGESVLEKGDFRGFPVLGVGIITLFFGLAFLIQAFYEIIARNHRLPPPDINGIS